MENLQTLYTLYIIRRRHIFHCHHQTSLSCFAAHTTLKWTWFSTFLMNTVFYIILLLPYLCRISTFWVPSLDYFAELRTIYWSGIPSACYCKPCHGVIDTCRRHVGRPPPVRLLVHYF